MHAELVVALHWTPAAAWDTALDEAVRYLRAAARQAWQAAQLVVAAAALGLMDKNDRDACEQEIEDAMAEPGTQSETYETPAAKELRRAHAEVATQQAAWLLTRKRST